MKSQRGSLSPKSYTKTSPSITIRGGVSKGSNYTNGGGLYQNSKSPSRRQIQEEDRVSSAADIYSRNHTISSRSRAGITNRVVSGQTTEISFRNQRRGASGRSYPSALDKSSSLFRQISSNQGNPSSKISGGAKYSQKGQDCMDIGSSGSFGGRGVHRQVSRVDSDDTVLLREMNRVERTPSSRAGVTHLISTRSPSGSSYKKNQVYSGLTAPKTYRDRDLPPSVKITPQSSMYKRKIDPAVVFNENHNVSANSISSPHRGQISGNNLKNSRGTPIYSPLKIRMKENQPIPNGATGSVKNSNYTYSTKISTKRQPSIIDRKPLQPAFMQGMAMNGNHNYVSDYKTSTPGKESHGAYFVRDDEKNYKSSPKAVITQPSKATAFSPSPHLTRSPNHRGGLNSHTQSINSKYNASAAHSPIRQRTQDGNGSNRGISKSPVSRTHERLISLNTPSKSSNNITIGQRRKVNPPGVSPSYKAISRHNHNPNTTSHSPLVHRAPRKVIHTPKRMNEPQHQHQGGPPQNDRRGQNPVYQRNQKASRYSNTTYGAQGGMGNQYKGIENAGQNQPAHTPTRVVTATNTRPLPGFSPSTYIVKGKTSTTESPFISRNRNENKHTRVIGANGNHSTKYSPVSAKRTRLQASPYGKPAEMYQPMPKTISTNGPNSGVSHYTTRNQAYNTGHYPDEAYSAQKSRNNLRLVSRSKEREPSALSPVPRYQDFSPTNSRSRSRSGKRVLGDRSGIEFGGTGISDTLSTLTGKKFRGTLPSNIKHKRDRRKALMGQKLPSYTDHSPYKSPAHVPPPQRRRMRGVQPPPQGPPTYPGGEQIISTFVPVPTQGTGRKRTVPGYKHIPSPVHRTRIQRSPLQYPRVTPKRLPPQPNNEPPYVPPRSYKKPQIIDVVDMSTRRNIFNIEEQIDSEGAAERKMTFWGNYEPISSFETADAAETKLAMNNTEPEDRLYSTGPAGTVEHNLKMTEPPQLDGQIQVRGDKPSNTLFILDNDQVVMQNPLTNRIELCDRELNPLKAIDGTPELEQAPEVFDNFRHSLDSEYFLWKSGAANMTIVQARDFVADGEIKDFWLFNGQASLPIAAVSNRDATKILGSSMIGPDKYGIHYYEDIAGAQIQAFARPVEEVIPALVRVTCMDVSFDGKRAYIAGSCRRDIDQGSAMVVAVELSPTLGIISSKALEGANYGVPHCLKRVKGTEQMIVGCDDHFAILEFVMDNGQLVQLATLLDIHRGEITDFILRNDYLWSKAYGEDFIVLTRLDTGNFNPEDPQIYEQYDEGEPGFGDDADPAFYEEGYPEESSFEEGEYVDEFDQSLGGFQGGGPQYGRRPSSKLPTKVNKNVNPAKKAAGVGVRQKKVVSGYSDFAVSKEKEDALIGLEKVVVTDDGETLYTGGRGLHMFNKDSKGRMIPTDLDYDRGINSGIYSFLSGDRRHFLSFSAFLLLFLPFLLFFGLKLKIRILLNFW